MVGGELAAAANLDIPLDGHVEDGLDPLVPWLCLVNGSDDLVVRVHEIDEKDRVLGNAPEGS
jgi:hypothetical protein